MAVESVPRQSVAYAPDGTIIVIADPQIPLTPNVAIRRHIDGESFWEVTGTDGPVSTRELWELHRYPQTVLRVIP